jgi:hypothetical protein
MSQYQLIPVTDKSNTFTVVFDGLPILDGETGSPSEYDLNGTDTVPHQERVFSFKRSMNWLAWQKSQG